ncbi:MAG: dihydrodipicolinate synthase family protein [Acidobacteriota bacterium]|nr:dihydrodipicolinate synthase family protein [Acidobacteriota bacterium]
MTNSPLHGILPALVTPLKDDCSLDTAVLERLLEHVYRAGCHGVYLCGSTGEGLLLPAAMRRQIVEVARRNTPPGRTIIVHVGSWRVDESRDLARHAEQHGAAAVSAIRPHGASFPETIELVRSLARATALPFFAYYFPEQSGGPLGIGQLERICALPGVAGLKFTDYDLYTLSLLARQGKTIFNGRDEVLLAGLLMGAAGGIGSIYNMVPGWFVELYDHARAGRWAEGRAVQDRINSLIRVLVSLPFLPALKRALDWQGLACGFALAPRLRLSETEDRALAAALEALPGLPRV